MAYSGSSAAILATYDEALKYMYLPAIQEYLNNDRILAQKIATNETDVSGKLAYIENHFGRSTGIGARADGGALPEADYQKFKKSEVPMKYNYGRVTFSGPTIKATRDERGAYAKVVENEIEGIVKDVMKDHNRQMWGSGYGVIARLGGASVATQDPYTVQKKYCNNAAGGDFFGSTFGSKYIDEWATVNASYGSGGYQVVTCTFSAGVTVATMDTDVMKIPLTGVITEHSSGAYVTLGTTHTDPAPSPAEAAGGFLVRAGNFRSITSGSAAGYGRLEMMGLRGIVTDTDVDDAAFSDGTYTGFKSSSAPTSDPLQGLLVASYPWFKAQVMTASGGRYTSQRQLTPTLMQQMFDKVELKAGKDYGPDMIITTHAIRREYLDYMEARRRNVNTMALDGGWTAIDYNGVPLMVDPDAIDGEMYFLTLKDLQVYRMSDYDWMDQDGAILSRITGYDAYEAVLFRYAELGCNNRRTHGVLCDLAYTPD
jgi:hypothetical protein